MANQNETTTSFKVDISELKSEFQEAQRIVRVANSEFKAASATMDDWSTSADGLTAKVDQLSTVLDAEKTKLSSLTRQYELTADAMGENSREAQELLVRLNNQRATVSNVERSLEQWRSALNSVGNESEDFASKVKRQESELSDLKDEYARIATEQGQSSDAARALGTQIQNLSSELSQNRTALRNARSAADEFDESLDDVDDSAEDAASGGLSAFTVALGDLLADGIEAVISGLKDMVTEVVNMEGAYNKFQAATGATTEEMVEFKEEMNELYKNAYGESLEDIGDKMAYVKQVTGEVDASKIAELTENAMALEDTFGSDFNETIRGVNNLMIHFGIDSEEAFDLFAKGSQEGLDYTSELGDNIAEYGGNFAQAGYSAEEYFQLLKNGAESGAYNLDKVNDSINEVKNRLGDGTIEKNLDSFSDETKTVFKGWQNGEKTMKDVIDAIVSEISDCTSETEALTKAQIAFGTMGEDANLDVVKSLTTLGEEFEDVTGTMEEMKDVRYDDLETQLETLGRTIKTDVLLPLVEQALPSIKSGVDWIINNLDTLVPIVTTVAAAFATMWAITKVSAFVQAISSLIGIVKGLTTATVAQTAAQTALNTTNPFGWVALAITGIGALIGVMVSLSGNSMQTAEDFAKLTESEQALRDKTDALTSSYESWNTAKEKAASGVSAEFSYYNELVAELDGIVDANGRIKAGYEDRAAVITGILSEALGIEIQTTDNVIANYDELHSSIEKVIEIKKAEAMLTAYESAYTEAIKNKNAALEAYMENQKQSKTAAEELAAAQEELRIAQEKFLSGENNGRELMVLSEKVEGLTTKFNDQTTATTESEEAYLGYIETIQNYEGLSAAIISGDTDAINQSLLLLEHGFVTAETATKEALENQVKNYKEQLDNLKKAIEEKTPGVTQTQVNQMAELVEKSEAELAKLTPKAEAQGEEAASQFGQGMFSQMQAVESDAQKISIGAADELDSADTTSKGTNFVDGFRNGMNNGSYSIWETARSIAGSALQAMKDALNINSPSKEAETLGQFFSKGLAVGIGEEEKTVMKTVSDMAKNIVSEMETSLDVGTNLFSDDIAQLGNRDFSTNATAGEIKGQAPVTNVTNFYQTNTSPKSLSRLDIYRQTQNQLNFVGGVQ